MKMEITGSHGRLHESDIAEAESALGVSFPADYREFLLEHNGGRPRPDTFPIENNPSDTQGMVNFFFHLKDEGPYSLLKWARRMQGRIPSGFLPVAIDPGGNLICLSVAGGDRGKVYFWDHEEEAEEGEPPTRDNVYPVAGSFDEFMASLVG